MATALLINNIADRLHSKIEFDMVQREITKPSADTEGLWSKTSDLADTKSNIGNRNTPNIANPLNLYKQSSGSMSDEGFIKLPRSLIYSSGWRDLRIKQQKFFLYILQRVQFTPKKERNNGKEFVVMPGQLFISYRSLVQDYNASVKYKDEKIDLSFLQRAVSAFLANGWADTQTDTGITVITITQSDLYDHFKSLSDTQTDTETIQRRYNEKERKEREEYKETIDRADAPVRSFSSNNKKEQEISDEKKDKFDLIWKYLTENQMCEESSKNAKGVKKTDLMRWLRGSHSAHEVFESIKSANESQVSSSYPAYIQTLLSKKVIKKKSLSLENKEYVEGTVNKNKMTHIELKKEYFYDKTNNEQTSYFLPRETLEEILRSSFNRAQSINHARNNEDYE